MQPFDQDALSPAQTLQLSAMLTDALSNLIDRSKHLCRDQPNGSAKHPDHEKLLRDTVELTAATITEAIQALIPATKVEVEGPANPPELQVHVPVAE